MAIKIQTNFFSPIDKPKMYLVYILIEKHIPWKFCMRITMDVFQKSEEDAMAIVEEILSDGEGLCGAYMYEIAETKAKLAEKIAKKEGYSLQCLMEEV